MSILIDHLRGAQRQLASVRTDLRALDAGHLDASGLRHVMAEARSTERLLAAVVVEIGRRARELAEVGQVGDPVEPLLDQGQVSAGQARTEARRADVAFVLPLLGDALADGVVGPEHLDAVGRASRHLDPEQQTALQQQEVELLEAARRMPVDTFNRHLRRQVDRIRNDHGLQRALDQRACSTLRTWTGADGMGHFRGDLDPERFAVLAGAIDRQMAALAASSDGTVVKDHHLAATALVDLVGHGNGRQGRAHITLLVDAQTARRGAHGHTLSQTADGAELPPQTIDRFACDAVIRKVVLDDRGVPIDVGRRYRTATDAQWHALRSVHSTCAWSGCDRPISWCQAHHVLEWERHGLTDLDNLVPLCSSHHHQVHEGGWSLQLLADRTLRIRRPDGRHHVDVVPNRGGAPSAHGGVERPAARAGPGPLGSGIPEAGGRDPTD